MGGRPKKLDPWVILVDTREQLPLAFGATPTHLATLTTGDYAIAPAATPELPLPIAIERKSLPDLLGCIGNSRDRFEREIERLSKLKYAAIVIEGSIQDLIRGVRFSEVHIASVMGSLRAWDQRFGVRFHFAGDRTAAAALTRKLLVGFATDWTEGKLNP